MPINKKKKKQEDLAMILSSPCETSSNGIHLKTRRVIRELIGHMMVEIYDHQCQLTKKKKKQEDLAIILSSPCETSSNGIHLKTRRVIRELIGHMMVEIYDHRCQLAKEKKRKPARILFSPCETSSNGVHLKTCKGADWSYDSSNWLQKNCILERLEWNTGHIVINLNNLS